MEFNVGNKARLIGLESYTGWTVVKTIVYGIQHAVNPTDIPTIAYAPRTQAPAASPFSLP